MKSKRNIEEYDYKCECLNDLQRLEKQKHIDIYYGDEVGFSLNCVIPYAWQFKNEPIEILPQRGKTINTFGIMNLHGNQVVVNTKEGSIKSDFVINAIEEWLVKIQKPTVLILDNAPIHKAKIFQDKIQEWQTKNLFIFFLPPYSPHLNRIETLWRKTKYQWIKPKDYLDLDTLNGALNHIWNKFGNEYVVNFKER